MGYDVKRFLDLGVLAEDITCPICMNVFRDPVTTKCRHTYCRDCISEWLARHQTCPLDQSPVELYGGLTKPPIFVINILGRLLISCDYKGKGCQATVKLEDLSKHVSSCPFRPKPAVSQVLFNLSRFANQFSFPNLSSWINRINHSEHPPTPPVRIRPRPRHTELARQREQRDDSEREAALTSLASTIILLLTFAFVMGILFRFAVFFLVVFLIEHSEIVFFWILLALIYTRPQSLPSPLPHLRQFDDLLP